ncbi:hypothetical protein [Streptomyces sp. S186]|uniref:hypothetical protein n=1 Tax=Streptomyces sp. S186 TaxID=3434395 RepID=UPI003F6625E2
MNTTRMNRQQKTVSRIFAVGAALGIALAAGAPTAAFAAGKPDPNGSKGSSHSSHSSGSHSTAAKPDPTDKDSADKDSAGKGSSKHGADKDKGGSRGDDEDWGFFERGHLGGDHGKGGGHGEGDEGDCKGLIVLLCA